MSNSKCRKIEDGCYYSKGLNRKFTVSAAAVRNLLIAKGATPSPISKSLEGDLFIDKPENYKSDRLDFIHAISTRNIGTTSHERRIL